MGKTRSALTFEKGNSGNSNASRASRGTNLGIYGFLLGFLQGKPGKMELEQAWMELSLENPGIPRITLRIPGKSSDSQVNPAIPRQNLRFPGKSLDSQKNCVIPRKILRICEKS